MTDQGGYKVPPGIAEALRRQNQYINTSCFHLGHLWKYMWFHRDCLRCHRQEKIKIFSWHVVTKEEYT